MTAAAPAGDQQQQDDGQNDQQQQGAGGPQGGQQSGDQQQQQNDQGKGSTPPWGSAENFDPEKAWRLIENLRGERDQYKTKVTEHQRAQETEQQRIERERDEARTTAAETAAEAARLRAAIAYGLTEDDLELLEGVPAEKVDERAKRIAERLGKSEQTTPPPPGGRPRENLRGGGDPTTDPIADEGDVRKIAERMFRR